MTVYSFRPAGLPNYDHWVYFKNFLSKDECERIKSLMLQERLVPATVDTTGVDKSLREALIQWIGPGIQETDWIYEKLTQVILSCNASRWRFDLSGFFEPIQLTHYRSGDFHDWHMDSGKLEFSIRKLSIIIQLTDPAEYEGGEIEFFRNGTAIKDQGGLILFPSYIHHKVHPITQGERQSLVAWVSGSPWR